MKLSGFSEVKYQDAIFTKDLTLKNDRIALTVIISEEVKYEYKFFIGDDVVEIEASGSRYYIPRTSNHSGNFLDEKGENAICSIIWTCEQKSYYRGSYYWEKSEVEIKNSPNNYRASAEIAIIPTEVKSARSVEQYPIL